MDALTLLTLPLDTGVHVHGFLTRCPLCVVHLASSNHMMGVNTMDGQMGLGNLSIGSLVEHLHRKALCQSCYRPLRYEVTHG